MMEAKMIMISVNLAGGSVNIDISRQILIIYHVVIFAYDLIHVCINITSILN